VPEPWNTTTTTFLRSPGSWGICLAIAYLLIHSGMILLASRRPQSSVRILLTNLLLIACFAILLLGASPDWQEAAGLRFLRLWAPMIFFWWAYKWILSFGIFPRSPADPPGKSMARSAQPVVGKERVTLADRASPWILRQLLPLHPSPWRLSLYSGPPSRV